eukprot:m.29753 g.29753  ORF g.29753 m.29753 type:complete len:318 (-) comp9189_c1_seq1:31-984(-)
MGGRHMLGLRSGQINMAALVLLLVAQAFAAPLLAWSSEPISVPNTLLRAGHQAPLEAFEGSFVKSVFEKKGLAVLFLQDHLSISDITLYGGVHGENSFSLHNTKAAFEHAGSAFALSDVSGSNGKVATALIKSFLAQADATGGKTLFVNQGDLSSLSLSQLSASSFNVIVAQMSPVLENGAVSASKLASNDVFIGKVLAATKQFQGTVSCLLLATGDDHVSQHFRRSLAPTASASPSIPKPSIPSIPKPPVFPKFAQSLDRPVTKSYLYFTIPLFMGVIVMFILIFFILNGVYGVSWTQTPQRWADTTDKCLIVPEN